MDVSRLDRTRIALLASLLLVGCSWTVPSDPVTEDSPAAAYAEGFWALEASGGAAFAERSPDGTARVLVDDSGQVRVEREGRVHLLQNRFTRGGFSLLVDGEDRRWPVAPGPELMHSSGELRREGDCLEVRIRGRAVASIRSGESELETRGCR